MVVETFPLYMKYSVIIMMQQIHASLFPKGIVPLDKMLELSAKVIVCTISNDINTFMTVICIVQHRLCLLIKNKVL